MKSNIKLGVNIDHAATLRQVRAATTNYPNLLLMTELVKQGGGDQITIHLREDRRHIQDADVIYLCKNSKLPINLEIAVSDKMLKVALKNKPKWVCFVPEKREELTTEGGLNIVKVFDEIKVMTKILQKNKIKVSYFIEPSPEQVRFSYEAGADAVEFHTGAWVLADKKSKLNIWNSLKKSAILAHSYRIRVHAGHGLDYSHAKKIKLLPHLAEVNIGHSLICYALEDGLKKATRKMLKHIRK